MEIDTDCAEVCLGVFWYAILWIRLFFWNRSVHLGRTFFVETYKYYS